MPVPAEAPAPQAPPGSRRSFLALLFTQICFGMCFASFFLLPKYLAQLGESEQVIGGIGAVGAVAGVIAFPLVGVLNDRFGRLRFVVLGNFAMTASALVMLTLREAFPGMYLVRIVQGLAFALSFNSITTLATDGVKEHRLGQVLALFGTALLGTQALGPALAESLAIRVGWNAVFWCSAGFGAMSVASALLFLSEAPRAQQVVAARVRPTQWSVVSDNARVLTAVCAAGAGFGTLITFSQPFALQRGIERVAGFFVAYALCAVAVRFVAIGRLERVGRRQVSAGSLLLYAVAVAATAWLRPGALEPIGAVMGIAHGVFYPVCNALALSAVPSSERGSMMALYHGAFNAGFAVAALLGGTVAAHLGYAALFLGTATLVGIAALRLWTSDLTKLQRSTKQ